MKKTMICTAALLLTVGATTAFAAGPWHGGQARQLAATSPYATCAYVDADGDGVCDNCSGAHSRYTGSAYVDADGDGVCDNWTYGRGHHSGGGHHGWGGCRR